MSDKSVPEKVLTALNDAANRDYRVRIFYGSIVTGQDWGEENSMTGFVSRSTGATPVFILLPQRNSSGGGEIMISCIVKLMIRRAVVYQHPTYQGICYVVSKPEHDQPSEYPVRVDRLSDGVNVANFKTWGRAHRWCAFMTGERQTK